MLFRKMKKKWRNSKIRFFMTSHFTTLYEHVFHQYNFVQYWLSWWLAQQVLPFNLLLILHVLLSFLSLSHPFSLFEHATFQMSFSLLYLWSFLSISLPSPLSLSLSLSPSLSPFVSPSSSLFLCFSPSLSLSLHLFLFWWCFTVQHSLIICYSYCDQ